MPQALAPERYLVSANEDPLHAQIAAQQQEIRLLADIDATRSACDAGQLRRRERLAMRMTSGNVAEVSRFICRTM